MSSGRVFCDMLQPLLVLLSAHDWTTYMRTYVRNTLWRGHAHHTACNVRTHA